MYVYMYMHACGDMCVCVEIGLYGIDSQDCGG